MTLAACVAAPQPAAVDAARTAWRADGNALDLALAAATALVVTYPHQCGLGGDLVALVREPGGRTRAIVSAGAAPARVPVEQLRAAGERMPPGGPHTVTVPGVLAGWAALVDHGARLDLGHHLRHAADLASGGTPVSAGLAAAIGARHEVVRDDPGLRDLLLPGGVPLRAGAALVQPRLAATLRAIATEGPGVFYGGEVGRRLAAGVQRLGGTLDAGDLEAHHAEVADPLTASALGATWAVAPPPTQGATLLGLLSTLDGGELGLPATRRLSAARDALLGDPRRGAIDLRALLAGGPAADAPDPVRAAGDTVAVTAVDADGRAVALLQSVYQAFGAVILEPETGIVLHNRGSAFSLVPGHPGELAPGARPPHTLCPAMIQTTEGAIVAVGAQGGRAQPQVLAQLAGALSDDGTSLDDAIAAPRWVVGGRDMGRERETVLLEPGARSPDTEAAAAGVPVERLDRPTDLAGHAQAARLARGVLSAGSDPRADGGALVLGADG